MLQNKLQQIPLYPLLFDVHYQSVLWGGNGFETYLNRKIPADQAPAGEAWEIFIQNVTQELLAGYIAGSVGNPKDFIITYSTTHNFSLQVKQYE